MTSALYSALSGLQAHEGWIGVIGNNLANASTSGFKSSRATFADQFSQNLRFASLPTGTTGGRNPVQMGLGVTLADIGRDMSQGALTNTGRVFDLAMSGRGNFMLSDGINTLYTRVGTFGLDGTSRLVDQRTGYLVLGQNGQAIDVDSTSLFPPSATTTATFTGNLPAEVTGPLAQVLTSTSAFADGTQASVSGSVNGPYTIPAGETWTMDLVVSGGAPQQVAVPSVTGTVTALDIVNAINALPSSGVTAAVTTGGSVSITSDRTGAAVSVMVVPGAAAKDLASLIGLPLNLVSGTEAVATGATKLNNLPSNVTDYVPGDRITISGLDTDGTPVSGTFVFGTGTGQDGDDLASLITFIDNLYPQGTPTLNATTGKIDMTADNTGATGLSLSIQDFTGSTGSTQWSQHAFLATTVGSDPDTATTSIEVFDQAGTAHTVTFTFERQDDGSWDVTPSIPPSEGTIIGTLTGLRFNANGTIATLPVTNDFTATFTGQPAQSVTLDLGTPSLYDGVTMFGGPTTMFADGQDGYGVGELSNMAVNGDGAIQGFYTNGQVQDLGQLGIANFVNENGLREVGNSLWAATANSGARTVSIGSQAGAGEVVGGALEGSNVEIAEEFVHLIEAQRGFQANARVITTTDQVLSELVNLLR
ncbi:MAG TPA: flagellar hook-basal body complex protein [Planctomycetota bacterium]|nr:flagellar hook-basal body complex protein [Planctomycetota bacterium]